MTNDELSTNQRKAIDALLNHSKIEDAANAAGLTTRTVYRYLADASFRDALHEQQDRITSATAARLVGGAGDALAVLERVMSDPDETGATRVRAAGMWLDAMRNAVELDQLAARVAALEAGR